MYGRGLFETIVDLPALLSFNVLKQDGFADSTRKAWSSYMDKVARPVISNPANDQLKEKIQVVLSDHIDNKERAKNIYGRWLA